MPVDSGSSAKLTLRTASAVLTHDMAEARTKRIKLGDHKTKKIKLGDNTASQPFSISHRRQIQSLKEAQQGENASSSPS